MYRSNGSQMGQEPFSLLGQSGLDEKVCSDPAIGGTVFYNLINIPENESIR
jgi:hypothetical protein